LHFGPASERLQRRVRNPPLVSNLPSLSLPAQTGHWL
jgi:hypothetical protein